MYKLIRYYSNMGSKNLLETKDSVQAIDTYISVGGSIRSGRIELVKDDKVIMVKHAPKIRPGRFRKGLGA